MYRGYIVLMTNGVQCAGAVSLIIIALPLIFNIQYLKLY
jgi:hypothetical protein